MQATQLTLDDINFALAGAAQADAEGAYLPAAAAATRHPFERARLGKAPFRCTGVDDAGARDEKCQFCTTAIRYVYHIAGSDGSRFQVGSECVKQTGGEVEGFATFNRQMEARVRQLQGEARKVREVQKKAAAAEAWQAEHAEEWAYMQARRDGGNRFYSYLCGIVLQFGSIYPDKLTSVRKDMETARLHREVTRVVPPAPVVNLEPVEAAFGKAKAAGIVWPKLRLGGFVFSPAGANSANAGAIYIKTRTPAGDLPGTYLGKVLGGKFFKARECDAAQEAEIVSIARDPKAAAVAYGKAFGKCSVCNRDLTDAESVANGIGPVCAGKYGF